MTRRARSAAVTAGRRAAVGQAWVGALLAVLMLALQFEPSRAWAQPMPPPAAPPGYPGPGAPAPSSSATIATPASPSPGESLPHETDRPPGEDAFVVVPLKYADVSEVVGILTNGLSVKSNDAFAPVEPAFGSPGLGGAPQPAPQQAAAQAGDPVAQSVDDTIGIDRRLNAIILRGSPERIARLKTEIAKLDVPVRSVLLETMFVELDETGAKNVGLDFTNSAGQIAVATFQTGAFIPEGLPTSHGLSSAQLQAAVYAQVQAGHGKIVSKPRIAAQSGGVAKIVTGDALPILTSIALSGVNAVSQQVQYVNVGVTLQIAPRVSPDGFVTSHIFAVVSSVSGMSKGYPTISQREAETSATVADGDTFVIGGLTQESDINSVSKVPGFGDIPLAGNLFSLKTGSHSKTELYIVVTPHVLSDGAVGQVPEQSAAAAPPPGGALAAATSALPDPAPTAARAQLADSTPKASPIEPFRPQAPDAPQPDAAGPAEVATSAPLAGAPVSAVAADESAPAPASQPPPALAVEPSASASPAALAAASDQPDSAVSVPPPGPSRRSIRAPSPAIGRLASAAALAVPARLTPASYSLAMASPKPAVIAVAAASTVAGASLWEIGLAGLGFAAISLAVALGWSRKRVRR